MKLPQQAHVTVFQSDNYKQSTPSSDKFRFKRITKCGTVQHTRFFCLYRLHTWLHHSMRNQIDREKTKLRVKVNLSKDIIYLEYKVLVFELM